MKRIAVFGASGFVGAELVETILEMPDVECVPVIHSTGNAWRLARRNAALRIVDILDPGATREAIRGCSHVVNCTRGADDVMFDGLKHLLAASRELRVERFVHLSSVAIYGDPPHPGSISEDAQTQPAKATYGWMKLRQDEMVREAARQGLPAVILCPPNIGGPGSSFIGGVLEALERRSFALVSDQPLPCVLVDVRNLVHAILLALDARSANGERLFITDGDETTWDDLVREVSGAIDPAPVVDRISRAELTSLTRSAGTGPSLSLVRSLKHLVSSDVRAAIRKDPLLAKADGIARRAVALAGRRVEDRMRLAVEGPLRVQRTGRWDHLNLALCRQQLRGVRHSSENARRLLGYQPVVSFAQSMAAFRRWFRATQGVDSEFWPLLRELRR